MTMMVDNPFKAGYFVAFWGVGPLDSHELVVEDFFWGGCNFFDQMVFFCLPPTWRFALLQEITQFMNRKELTMFFFLFWVFQTLQKSQTLGIPCKT